MPNLFFNHDERFRKKVGNFPDTLYRINDSTSKINRLLYALLEIGVAQAKGMQDIAIMAENSLANTTGQELDQYFQMFGIKRTPEFSRGLENFASNDARFRVAIAKFLQAVSLGGTAQGIRLMSEASTGFKCYVLEPWRNPEYWSDSSLPEDAFRPRLLDSNDEPLGNEVVVYVYPNKPLTAEEKNTLRVRVIENCKIIAPLHTTVTVNIEITSENLEFVPSYVTGGAFSYIEPSEDPELLSQEAEISFNDLVTNINTFEMDNDFETPFGYLNASIADDDTSIQVAEEQTPLSLNFNLKLTENGEEEILFVKGREFLSEPNIFVYQVDRGQMHTEPKAFSGGALAFSNLVPLYSDIQTAELNFEDWRPIPLADSPDNYPSGKYINDSKKYDAYGNYLFEWSTQFEFENWFKNYIVSIGGEIKDKRYRLLVNNNIPSETGSNSNIIQRIMGPAYKFLRPIPKPRN